MKGWAALLTAALGVAASRDLANLRARGSLHNEVDLERARVPRRALRRHLRPHAAAPRGVAQPVRERRLAGQRTRRWPKAPLEVCYSPSPSPNRSRFVVARARRAHGRGAASSSSTASHPPPPSPAASTSEPTRLRPREDPAPGAFGVSRRRMTSKGRALVTARAATCGSARRRRFATASQPRNFANGWNRNRFAGSTCRF